MSLARYLSKLGALLNSDGKVPAAALAAGAARANFGAGAVLQVVEATSASSVSLGSSVDGVYREYLSASITPTSATSKIAIIHTAEFDLGSGNYPCIYLQIWRGASYLGGKSLRGYWGNSGIHHIMSDTKTLIDSPSTTSQVTYSFKASNGSGSTPGGTYAGQMNNYETSRVLLMEIAA